MYKQHVIVIVVCCHKVWANIIIYTTYVLAGVQIIIAVLLNINCIYANHLGTAVFDVTTIFQIANCSWLVSHCLAMQCHNVDD